MQKTEITYDDQATNAAIELYGEIAQKIMLFEEMAELQKAVCKTIRGINDKPHLIEELADVYIMLEQLKIMDHISNGSVQVMIDYKIKRLNERLENSHEPE